MVFMVIIFMFYLDMFFGFFGQSFFGWVLEKGFWYLEISQIWDFVFDKYCFVDDMLVGGGVGMVLCVDIFVKVIDGLVWKNDFCFCLLMSLCGWLFIQDWVYELVEGFGVVLVCGCFEGVDQCVIDVCGFEEVCIGDYILFGGEIVVIILLDVVVWFILGVMGNMESVEIESFEIGFLEYFYYMCLVEFEGWLILEVLILGNYKKIYVWCMVEVEWLICECCLDLWVVYMFDDDDVD